MIGASAGMAIAFQSSCGNHIESGWRACYLAAWMIARLEGIDAAVSAMHDVAPVGEKDEYVGRAMRVIELFLEGNPAARECAWRK